MPDGGELDNQGAEESKGSWKRFLPHRLAFLLVSLDIVISQSVSCIYYSLMMIDYFFNFFDCSNGWLIQTIRIMVSIQKFNQFIIGLFLVLVIHYLALLAKRGEDIDYSSQFESEEDDTLWEI